MMNKATMVCVNKWLYPLEDSDKGSVLPLPTVYYLSNSGMSSNSLDTSEAAVIWELQEIMTIAHIMNDIDCIVANYSQLPEIICQLKD